MNSFYDEVLEEIESLMKDKKYHEALGIVERELKMPYVPRDFEKKLLGYKRDIKFYINDKKDGTSISIDNVLNKLKGKAESQLAACVALSKMNLRDFIDEVQDYLSKDPYPEASAYLLEAIAEQGLPDEFTLVRDGVEYNFYGDSLTPVSESKGYLEARELLFQWLENNHPDMLEMCKVVLAHKVYMFLPLSYDEGEGYTLALDVLQEVSSLIDDNETYNEIVDKNNKLN